MDGDDIEEEREMLAVEEESVDQDLLCYEVLPDEETAFGQRDLNPEMDLE